MINMKLSDREQGNIVTTDEFVLFWSGWPSQWFRVSFKALSHIENEKRSLAIDEQDNPLLYNCCEQFMMSEKARLFGDLGTLKKILATNSPKEQKALGRQVSDFDAAKWDAVCREVVFYGNLARFRYDKRSCELLLATGNRQLVEASPYDKIWGIGLAPDDKNALIASNWKGKNWLGEALMRVRAEIVADKTALP